MTLFGRLVDAALKEKEKSINRSSSESLDKTPSEVPRNASRQDMGSSLR